MFISEDQCLQTANILKSDDLEISSNRSKMFENTSITYDGICFRVPIRYQNMPNIGMDDNGDDGDGIYVCISDYSLKLNGQILLT
jgi:hypothetical protein